MRFVIGDYLAPISEWVGSSNNVPTGHVQAIEKWSADGAYRVGNDRRFFAAYVFMHAVVPDAVQTPLPTGGDGA